MSYASNGQAGNGAAWTFLTNHSHVIICLAHDPLIRLRDIAVLVGITERAVQRIVADLEEAGVLTRIRDGRRNTYELHPNLPLRHPVEAHCSVSDLIGMVANTIPSNTISSNTQPSKQNRASEAELSASEG